MVLIDKLKGVSIQHINLLCWQFYSSIPTFSMSSCVNIVSRPLYDFWYNLYGLLSVTIYFQIGTKLGDGAGLLAQLTAGGGCPALSTVGMAGCPFHTAGNAHRYTGEVHPHGCKNCPWILGTMWVSSCQTLMYFER